MPALIQFSERSLEDNVETLLNFSVSIKKKMQIIYLRILHLRMKITLLRVTKQLVCCCEQKIRNKVQM